MNTRPVSVSMLFLVAIGGLFLWAAHRAHRTGEIRGGSAGFRVYRPSRSESPFGFYSLPPIGLVLQLPGLASEPTPKQLSATPRRYHAGVGR